MTKTRNKESLKAIIYDRKGKVLSIGENNYTKSHPLQAKHAFKAGLPEKIYLHAEIDAIVRCYDLSKAYKIVVSRIGRKGFLNAKPCPVCMSAISSTNIQVIEHS